MSLKKVRIDFVTALSTCEICKKSDEALRRILKSYGDRIELNHVDMSTGKEEEIRKLRERYGIMMTPFIAVNGKVFTNGKSPREDDLRGIIEGALK